MSTYTYALHLFSIQLNVGGFIPFSHSIWFFCDYFSMNTDSEKVTHICTASLSQRLCQTLFNTISVICKLWNCRLGADRLTARIQSLPSPGDTDFPIGWKLYFSLQPRPLQEPGSGGGGLTGEQAHRLCGAGTRMWAFLSALRAAAALTAHLHASPHISQSRSIPPGKFPRGCRRGM